MVVQLSQVIAQNDFHSRRDVFKCVELLKKQGQIEPMQVHGYAVDLSDRLDKKDTYITFAQDVYASARLEAMSILGWDTVLIAIKKRYEQ